jgi:hypothetical protein
MTDRPATKMIVNAYVHVHQATPSFLSIFLIPVFLLLWVASNKVTGKNINCSAAAAAAAGISRGQQCMVVLKAIDGPTHKCMRWKPSVANSWKTLFLYVWLYCRICPAGNPWKLVSCVLPAKKLMGGEEVQFFWQAKLRHPQDTVNIFFDESTFSHAGRREKKSFFHAEITFFHARASFFHAQITFFYGAETF